VNIDGAYNPTTGEAAIGIITRDHEGQPHVMAWRVVSRCRDAGEAEALAFLDGTRPTEQWSNSTHVELETDCANLVQKVESKGMDHSVISALIMDIKEVMAKHALCTFGIFGGNKNKIAHNLGKFAFKVSWLSGFLFFLWRFIFKTWFSITGSDVGVSRYYLIKAVFTLKKKEG
jgi:hypothetical protein